MTRVLSLSLPPRWRLGISLLVAFLVLALAHVLLLGAPDEMISPLALLDRLFDLRVVLLICVFAMLVSALYPIAVSALPLVICSFALAYIVGYLMVLTPGGLGTRGNSDFAPFGADAGPRRHRSGSAE